MSDETTELLPCPFCGGEAEINRYTIKPYVSCTKCGCSMPDRHQTTEQAIEVWNTRAELGSGTCEVVRMLVARNKYERGRETVELSCGHYATRHDAYCPKCGRRVEQ